MTALSKGIQTSLRYKDTVHLAADNKSTKIFDNFLNTGGALAGVLLIAVMLLTSVKVFFRYVLQEGLLGVDQISGTFLLYITFFGAAWVLKREEHVSIELLVVRLRPKTRRWLNVINSIVGAIICLILTIYGSMEVIYSWQKGILIPAEIEIPRVVNLTVIPLGSLFLWIQFMRRAYQYFKGETLKQADHNN